MYQQDYKVVISLSLPVQLLGKIDELASRHRLKSRSAVIKQLLEVAIFIESKMGLVETWKSEDVESIKEQVESGQLVDWVAQLDHKKFETLMHVFQDETKARKVKK
jgi:metal-responsive CopG/Arc/MetJ family transcriptional regulator